MAKTFRKLLFIGAVAGAAYGLYCYNKKKNSPVVSTEDDDDFEDFSSDIDDEKPVETFKDKERKYVNLAFDKAKTALDAAQRAVTRTETYFNDEVLGDKNKAPEVVAETEATEVEAAADDAQAADTKKDDAE